MASLSMVLTKHERGGCDYPEHQRRNDPGPGAYDPHPLLNPATHASSNSQYFPDRKLQYPGGQVHSQQPMWLSLPVKERNRFWMSHRHELDQKKKSKLHKTFMANRTWQSEPVYAIKDNQIVRDTLDNTVPGLNPGTRGQTMHKMSKTAPGFFAGNSSNSETAKNQGEFMLAKSLDEIVYTNRDLPMTTFARCPSNLGNLALYKRVASEPTIQQHTTNTSTLSFGERRDLQRRFRLTRGMGKMQRKVLEMRQSLVSVASLARDAHQHARKHGGKDVPSWYVPPLPKEEGLGELLARKSLNYYKVNARARDIHPNAPNQRDCIGTRWTGVGNPMLHPITQQ